ncbi:MAG: AAA family ATPase [Proteobacteria bacterium]|nr:AAA family ATPase [Pseudomonadota bacterium]
MRIAVFNQKGGVGKTTTTLNLAAAAARSGASPLLLDLDPQCHLSGILGAVPADAGRSLFGFYQDVRRLDELTVPWEGIGALIPSHQQLIKVDSIFGKGPAILNKLRAGLDTLDAGAPPRDALIDCCPYIGVLSLNAIFACDVLLIPVSTDYGRRADDPDAGDPRASAQAPGGASLPAHPLRSPPAHEHRRA